MTIFGLAVPYYLDAGTGSMLVQMAVAGVAGVAVFAKVYWAKLTRPFRRNGSADADDEVAATSQPTED